MTGLTKSLFIRCGLEKESVGTGRGDLGRTAQFFIRYGTPFLAHVLHLGLSWEKGEII